MSAHPDVCIIGGGVIGLTTAYFLAHAGARVEVLERGEFGREASWAGAGILPPGGPSSDLPPYDQLRARSAVLYPELSAELRERTGLDNGYLRSGGLEFPGEDEAAAAEEWRGKGIAFESVDGQALRRLEPNLAPNLTHGYYLPDMAQVRNPRHIKALLAGCAAHGVVLRPGCPAHGFDAGGDRILAVRSVGETRAASRFLLATGAWTDEVADRLGWRPGIRPVRGQIVLLDTGPPRIRRVLCRGKRYLVPRPDGRVLVGSTEEDAGFHKHTTAAAVTSLLSLAVELVPVLAGARVERSWAGLRPGSPDGLPFLGLVPGWSNLYVAAGHFRSGLQLSPATGLVMKELLLGQPLTIPLDAFRPDRTGTGFRV